MIRLSASDAASLAGATQDGDDVAIDAVTVDSRVAAPGSLFVALAGTRDGHEFLADAYARGARVALVRTDATVPSGMTALRAADPLVALGMLAAGVRDRINPRVVAITGSAGKTCTKDFCAAVLSGSFETVASAASFNNEIGVPLTILAAHETTEALVVEVGARGVGHIRSLMPAVRPDVSVVTNVGSAHLGMFGSVDAIAEAKGEIVEALSPDGCAVLNADDERVTAMASRTSATVLSYGLGPEAGVRATEVVLDAEARATFTVHATGATARVEMPMPGEHMIANALAAIAVGVRLGVSLDDAAARLGSATWSAHRMHVATAPGGWTVVDDTYNASPAAMTAALKTLVAMGRGRRTWAVLGPMAELGDAAREEHDRIGRLAVRLGVGRLVVVGDDARALFEAARLEGMPPADLAIVADAETAAKTVLAEVASGDVVLVKAARVAALERVAEALLA